MGAHGSPTKAVHLADESELQAILLDNASRGVRVQVVLRGILVAFVLAVVLWIAPARDRVACDTIAVIYTVWAIGVAWLAQRRADQLVRFMWLALFVDLAALAGLAFAASSSVNQSWTSDVLVNGFFMIPLLAATQLRPWVCTAVAGPDRGGVPRVRASRRNKRTASRGRRSSCARESSPASVWAASSCAGWPGTACSPSGASLLDRSQLITELTTLEDRERQTLSEDLHDGALQYVLAARQDLEEARATADPTSFDRVAHALGESSQLLRSTMTQLHSAVLDQAGFLPALRDLARTSS